MFCVTLVSVNFCVCNCFQYIEDPTWWVSPAELLLVAWVATCAAQKIRQKSLLPNKLSSFKLVVRSCRGGQSSVDVVYPSSTNVGRTGEYKLMTSSKEPPSVGWSVVVGIAEGSPDLSELDFVGKKLVFLVEVAVAVLPQITNPKEYR